MRKLFTILFMIPMITFGQDQNVSLPKNNTIEKNDVNLNLDLLESRQKTGVGLIIGGGIAYFSMAGIITAKILDNDKGKKVSDIWLIGSSAMILSGWVILIDSNKFRKHHPPTN